MDFVSWIHKCESFSIIFYRKFLSGNYQGILGIRRLILHIYVFRMLFGSYMPYKSTACGGMYVDAAYFTKYCIVINGEKTFSPNFFKISMLFSAINRRFLFMVTKMRNQIIEIMNKCRKSKHKMFVCSLIYIFRALPILFIFKIRNSRRQIL